MHKTKDIQYVSQSQKFSLSFLLQLKTKKKSSNNGEVLELHAFWWSAKCVSLAFEMKIPGNKKCKNLWSVWPQLPAKRRE